MRGVVRMCELAVGRTGTVAAVPEGKLTRRLLDLGLVEGSDVTCLHRHLGGGICAYLICGAVIALRDADCADVMVRCEA